MDATPMKDPIAWAVYIFVLAMFLYGTQSLIGNEITSLISKSEA